MGRRSRQRRKAQHGRTPDKSKAPARSHEQKLSRAQEHLQEIEDTIRPWIKAGEKTVTEEPDPECPGATGVWIDPPPIPAHLGLLIGDCLQCFRTTLDHLAFELATAFTPELTDHAAETSQFPIFGDVNKSGTPRTGSTRFHASSKSGVPNNGSGIYQVQFIDPKAQTEIELLQPYKRGDAFEEDPLWQLNELNRVDKHRTLHVVGAVNVSVTMDLKRMVNVAEIKGGIMRTFGPRVEGRTQIFWTTNVLVPKVPGKEMRMNYRPALDVAFDAGTPVVAEVPVLDVLTGVNEHIVRHVLPPLIGFLK